MSPKAAITDPSARIPRIPRFRPRLSPPAPSRGCCPSLPPLSKMAAATSPVLPRGGRSRSMVAASRWRRRREMRVKSEWSVWGARPPWTPRAAWRPCSSQPRSTAPPRQRTMPRSWSAAWRWGRRPCRGAEGAGRGACCGVCYCNVLWCVYRRVSWVYMHPGQADSVGYRWLNFFFIP